MTSTPRSTTALAIPLLGSLAITYGIVWLACPTPWSSTLSWAGLLRTAAVFVLVTAVAHAAAVLLNRRLFRGEVDAPASTLILVAWPAVAWLPLLVLLRREESVWVALLVPVIAASAVRALHRWSPATLGGGPASAATGVLSTLFHPRKPEPLPYALAPAIVASLALEAAVVALLLDRPLLAGWLLAACIAPVLWSFPLPAPPLPPPPETGATEATPPPRKLAGRTLAVFLLLAVALMPYLRTPTLAGTLLVLLAKRPGAVVIASPKPNTPGGNSSGSYSGIILVLPSKPRPKIVVPPPIADTPEPGARPRDPIVIPFDGAYWYFKLPDHRPRADAPIVRADPIRKSIRSTDMLPLSMEAHQRLASPLDLGCCRAIRVAVHNADTVPGAISIEVLLGNQAASAGTPGASVSLGDRLLTSSVPPRFSLNRPPVDETLSFSVPPHTPARRFDEITVAIKPAPDRRRAGAHIAIQSFELVP